LSQVYDTLLVATATAAPRSCNSEKDWWTIARARTHRRERCTLKALAVETLIRHGRTCSGHPRLSSTHKPVRPSIPCA